MSSQELSLIGPDSDRDIQYTDSEINRGLELNRDFMVFEPGVEPGSLLSLAIHKARTNDSLRILDAGCGTGYGLYALRDQIEFRSPLAIDDIHAVGVSLEDYRSRLDELVGWKTRESLYNGDIDMRIGNLATMELEPDYYDIAYSYQVLLHNEAPEKIVANVVRSLRAGGAYFYEAPGEQQVQLAEFTDTLPRSEWDIDTRKVTRTFYDNTTESRYFTRLTRFEEPDESVKF